MNKTINLFLRTIFVLDKTSHGGNVGAAARALKTMQFSNLVLCNSSLKDIHLNSDAIAMASNAQDTLANIKVVENLSQALSEATLTFAMTARKRKDFESVDIRQMAIIAHKHLLETENHKIAVVMGNEQSGLDNASLYDFNYVVNIPANPEYSSLNVAQALQLAAWELRYEYILTGEIKEQKMEGEDIATHGQMNHLIKSVESILSESGYEKEKLASLERKLTHILLRAKISKEEVQMLLGIVKFLKAQNPNC